MWTEQDYCCCTMTDSATHTTAPGPVVKNAVLLFPHHFLHSSIPNGWVYQWLVWSQITYQPFTGPIIFMASPISTPRLLPQLPIGLTTFLFNHQLARLCLYVNAILASFMDLPISKNETSGNIHPTTPHHTPEHQIHQLRCCENLNTNIPSLWKQGFHLLLLLFGNFKWIL